MNLLKNKVLISLLTLLVFVSQVTVNAMPCKMQMNHQSSSEGVMMDHSSMSMTNTSISMSHTSKSMKHNEMMGHSKPTMSKSMDCCNQDADCSMGSCFSMLASINVPMVKFKINQLILTIFSFAILEQLPTSLYRPPISL